jgi:RNA-directed DNA polymerase
MQTELRAIAKKANERREYRFRNLYTMLNKINLDDSWRFMNRRAAPGVDARTVRDYERTFSGNISDLVMRLKRKCYRAQMVRRVNIPKGGGKMRPLGIPATEDKLVQTTVARILSAIYEQDFLPGSYGYRRNIGPIHAVRELRRILRFENARFVVEADIKGFFDNIDHKWLIRMLKLRVDDEAFIRLIQKWLRAGVLDTTGQTLHPVSGTPQGGVVSPVLANVYLHYALDLWFEKVVKRHCRGEAYIVRYADDFVCMFRYKADADRFYASLGKRLGKFGLELSPEKTRTIRFNMFRLEEGSRFDFLGFEFSWGKNRKGEPTIRLRTARKKFRASLRSLKEWCRENRSVRLREFFKQLNVKLRGYYNYYGVIGNYSSLREFHLQAVRLVFRSLNRRSHRRSFNWQVFNEILEYYQVVRPSIVEKTYGPAQYQLPFR